ncbi:MAG: ABC transporter ATP-binding protein [Minwuia sp.]|uniref:ABC transporter ATP-binding protein n=1 Tax=Minwuia sp. TaxID=2493630 RepID=UPI003A89701E
MTTPTDTFDAINTCGLRKTYRGKKGEGSKEALKGIDLAVPKGSFFALLGPNGAGKSTFINILAGLVIKSGGEAQVWGRDIDREPRQARAAIGVVPQELNLDAFFTPREVVEFQAGLYGVPRKERATMEVLDAMGLADKADVYSRTLSGGMRRRLLVAKAMIHRPPVLILDEPTAGVDVELRQQLWRYIRELNQDGTTIVLTTHYLEEAEELCDHIAIISQGELVASEPKELLISRLDQKTIAIRVAEEVAVLPDSLAARGAALDDFGRIAFAYQPSETAIGELLAAVGDAGFTIADISTEESDLEDVFLSITRSIPDAAE